MDFKQLHLKAVSVCSWLDESDCTRVYISASGDNSAGSDVSAALAAGIKSSGLKAAVITAGSFGCCDIEPIVRIEKPGQPSILYGNVTPEDAPALIKGIAGEGKIEGIPGISELPLFSLQQRTALRNCGHIDPYNIDHFITEGQGCSGLDKALHMSPDEVISKLKESGLKGKGGAGYPAADKWRICRNAEGGSKYVVCNAVDSDPHSNAVRLLLESDPYSVFEGILIAAYAVGASRCFICINERNAQLVKKLEKALEQMRAYSLLGENILESGFGTEIEIKTEPDLLVSGEETALIRSLEGKQAMPYIRTVYPAVRGIENKPTLINNAETLACVPAVFQESSYKFDTKIVSLAGCINHQYTVEVPFGTTLRDIIDGIGGGLPEGSELKAVQFGGPTGALFDTSSLDTAVGFDSMKKSGSIIGSGVLEVFGGGSCAVEITRDIISYLNEQSCGKCVFCREGSHQMYEILKDIAANKNKPADMEMIAELCEAMKEGCICGFGSTMPNPVLSGIRLFAKDYDSHIAGKKCSADGNG